MRANTKLRHVWYTVLVVAILGFAVFLKMNTHLDHCHNTIDGRVCDVVWGRG